MLQSAWSPDGQRLAFTDYTGVFVVRVNSRPRPLGASITPKPLLSPALTWSPDGRRLMLSAHEGDDPDQIWVVGSDGRGLRRLTSAGANNPLGWTRLRPVLPPAAPVPTNERVLGANTIATRGPIGLLSADGERVAFVSATTATDCEHVDAWTPAKKSILRVSQPLPAPCSFKNVGLVGYGVYELALAGSRVAWSDIVGCGNFCDVAFSTATMPQPHTLVLDNDSGGGARRRRVLALQRPRRRRPARLQLEWGRPHRRPMRAGTPVQDHPEWSAHVSRGVGLRPPDRGARTQRGRRARRPGLTRQRPSVRPRRSQGSSARRPQARRRSLGIARSLRRGHRSCGSAAAAAGRIRAHGRRRRYRGTPARQDDPGAAARRWPFIQADACAGPCPRRPGRDGALLLVHDVQRGRPPRLRPPGRSWSDSSDHLRTGRPQAQPPLRKRTGFC